MSKHQTAKSNFCIEMDKLIKVDRWGHYKIKFNGKTYRVKIQKNNYRFEWQVPHGWMRMFSGKFAEGIAPLLPYIFAEKEVKIQKENKMTKTTVETESTVVDPIAEIVASGFKAGATEDEIKGEMFKAKVPFGKINAMYKAIGIAKGLIVDPKVVTAEVTAQIVESDWESIETWDQVAASAIEIAEEVNGANSTRVLTLITKYCEENTITLPEKTRAARVATSRGGKVAQCIHALFSENPVATREDLFKALLASGAAKAEKNAKFYVGQQYVLAYALKHNCALKEVPVN